jgi:hypothetical protein
LFTNFIDELYQLKIEGDPTIKLLLNAGLGRFGIKINPSTAIIIPENEVNDILIKYRVINNIPLFKNKNNEIIEYVKFDSYNLIVEQESAEIVDEKIINDYKNLLDLEQSLPLAMAVTSYARIFINEFLIKYKENVYYICYT